MGRDREPIATKFDVGVVVSVVVDRPSSSSSSRRRRAPTSRARGLRRPRGLMGQGMDRDVRAVMVVVVVLVVVVTVVDEESAVAVDGGFAVDEGFANVCVRLSLDVPRRSLPDPQSATSCNK